MTERGLPPTPYAYAYPAQNGEGKGHCSPSCYTHIIKACNEAVSCTLSTGQLEMQYRSTGQLVTLLLYRAVINAVQHDREVSNAVLQDCITDSLVLRYYGTAVLTAWCCLLKTHCLFAGL